MSLARSHIGAFSVLLASAMLARDAYAADPAAALDELKQGYALKKDGNCGEAIRHFERSQQLNPTAKALLNLSDCEARTGNLVAAQVHATEGRRLAEREGDADLTAVADGQLGVLERRLPRLLIALSPDAPRNSIVSRDGLSVAPSSVGVAIAVNPGKHVIAVRAEGFAARVFEVSIVEGARERIEVAPGQRLVGDAKAPEDEPAARGWSSLGARKVAALAFGGAGVVAVGVGTVFGLNALSKNSDSNANGHCDSAGCDPIGKQLRNDALGSATLSTIAFVAGATLIAGGAVLWITAPAEHASRVTVGGTFTGREGGVVLQGSW